MQLVTQSMAFTLAIFSSVIVVLSAYGAVFPHRIIDLVGDNMSRGVGLWIAVVVRLVFAALLWFTAPVSQTPFLFKVVAVVLLVSAIGHQIAGRTHLRKLIEAMAIWPLWTIRIPCILGVLLGVFLLWSISNVLGAA
ncbi:MAG: hypothetical protein ACI9CB_002435 [Rhodothermales bacterium]|jgi:hypothetical protein